MTATQVGATTGCAEQLHKQIEQMHSCLWGWKSLEAAFPGWHLSISPQHIYRKAPDWRGQWCQWKDCPARNIAWSPSGIISASPTCSCAHLLQLGIWRNLTKLQILDETGLERVNPCEIHCLQQEDNATHIYFKHGDQSKPATSWSPLLLLHLGNWWSLMAACRYIYKTLNVRAS